MLLGIFWSCPEFPEFPEFFQNLWSWMTISKWHTCWLRHTTQHKNTTYPSGVMQSKCTHVGFYTQHGTGTYMNPQKSTVIPVHTCSLLHTTQHKNINEPSEINCNSSAHMFAFTHNMAQEHK